MSSINGQMKCSIMLSALVKHVLRCALLAMGLTRDNVVKALNNALAIILGVVIALLAGEKRRKEQE